jgi:hypothetical protein
MTAALMGTSGDRFAFGNQIGLQNPDVQEQNRKLTI